MALEADDSAGRTTLSNGAKMSRATVRLAMAALQQRYALDEDAAFEVLREASQRHNVKLRMVAAKMISAPAITPPRHCSSAPALPFTVGGRSCTNYGEVLSELMRVAVSRAGADRGTVQLRDPVHGGLQIEGNRGFGQGFVDTFSYLSGQGTPCGHAFDAGSQTVVTDVQSSRLFDEPSRATLLAHDVHSCVSTPILDNDGTVRGIVSSHQRRREVIPTEAELRQLRALANQCGRWLEWYDQTVLPAAVAAAYEVAAGRAGDGQTTAPPDPTAISAASRLLTDRYGVDPPHARGVLEAIAAQRGISLDELAARVAGRTDQQRDR